MTESQWKAFSGFRDEFRDMTEKWAEECPHLAKMARKAAEQAGIPDYPVETPIVYNTSLDGISPDDRINLIVIGDNPGKDEQLAVNRRYLVGQAGKLAENFFRKNPELDTNFRKNVIILNKTPVHSAKTAMLRKMMAEGGDPVSSLIRKSQLWSARKTAELHRNLCEAAENGNAPELWLVGYSELKPRGFFSPYRDEFRKTYGNSGTWKNVLVFQHFSMNRFSIDLKEFRTENPQLTTGQALNQLGTIHRDEIFGFSQLS